MYAWCSPPHCTCLHVQDGLWGGSNDEADPQLEVYMCPIPYCQCVDRNSVTCDNLFYQEDPLARKQCHALRDGEGAEPYLYIHV